jgi:hypothetical protein
MRRNLHQRRLAVESLETRTLLAGDVKASVDAHGHFSNSCRSMGGILDRLLAG